MEELECKRHRRRWARASADFQGVCAACVEERLAKILQARAAKSTANPAASESASSSRPSEIVEIGPTQTIASLIEREISTRRLSSSSDGPAPAAPPPHPSPGSSLMMKSKSTGWILNKLSLVTTPGSSPSRKGGASSSSSKNSTSSFFSMRSRSARPASSAGGSGATAGSSPFNPRFYRPSRTCSSAATLSLRKLRHCFLPTATSHDPLHT